MVSFVYDGDGNRVARTVNGVTTQYLVDVNNPTGNSQVVDELIGGQVTRSYTFGPNLISQRQLIAGQWQVSFYGYDGQGNVRLLTDFARAITDTYEFDAFGNLIAKTGNTPNEHLYVGEHFDANIGFYYLRARYLSPASGRFLTLDSFEGMVFDPVSLHKYLYAGADPVDRSDPTGHFFGFAAQGISAAVDLGTRGWGGIMGAAFLEYIKFLLIGIAITVITVTTIEIAKRIQIPIRVYHYTDWVTFGKIVASNQVNNPFGTGNYFTPDVYIFEETARDRLAICRPLSVALSLNVYLSTDGLGPTTPVGPKLCTDGVKNGRGNEMSTMRPVPYLTRQPSFHPLF